MLNSSKQKYGRIYKDFDDYKKFYNDNDYKKLTMRELKTSPDWFERSLWTQGVLKKKGSILDVGCQTGVISMYYAYKGWRVVGIDINSKAIRFCKKMAKDTEDTEFFTSAYEDIHFGEKFDYVIVQEIIEHVLDPEDLLDFADRSCKKGGKVVLTTPNYYGEFGRQNIGSKGDRGEHIRCYKASELMQLVLIHGEVKSFDGDDLLKVVYEPKDTLNR